jgi:phage terminase large subunit
MSEITLPAKLDFLLQEKIRYKGAYGGRGSAKSWSIAKALLVKGVSASTRILCGRELQKSIKDSVHQLLCDQISELNLGYYYTVTEKSIKSKNGTSFGFIGLKHNALEIKSHEGADIAWIEEAQAVSKKSWDILIPTIRKPDSEIWLSFNPELEDDETYQRFVVNPPKQSRIVPMNWRDNPWFPEVLRMEMEEKKERNYDDYLHIWEGHPKHVLDGAIFAEELRKAKLENRISTIPYDKTKPVHTFWDLGWNSLTGRTAIIMAQVINNAYHIIDYLEDAEHTVDWYINELQKKNYIWGTDYLPHDAKSTNIAAGGRTVEKIMIGLGRKVRVLKRTTLVGNDIVAAKEIFDRVYIDRHRCADLIQCLNRYKYKIDEDTGLRSKNPEPNIYIHGADAFRQFAVAITDEKAPKKNKKSVSHRYTGAGAWMG